MAQAGLLTTIRTDPGPRPQDEELDLFGLTHPGKIRRDNQDHFMVCTVHRQIVVHGTSLEATDSLPLRSSRLATILLVADGVAGARAGGEASELALAAITRYVSTSMECFHTSRRHDDKPFDVALQQAALEAHDAVRAESATRPGEKRMATTLTLAIAVWPELFVMQVGDSRCYHFQDGALHLLTRDQTLAQELVDRGALPADSASRSPLSNVLVSSIGGDATKPVVTRVDLNRTAAVLLCTDGLTRHVSDEEIADHFRSMESSEQLARALLDLALERGGSDNVTVLVGRAPVGGTRAST